MHIHATDEQLEQLKKLNDPDEIDSYIAEILAQTNFGTMQLIKEASMDVASTLYKALPSFEIPSRTIEITINFALFVVGYILCRKYGINFIVVIVFSVLYFVYMYLDYECRKVCSFIIRNHNIEIIFTIFFYVDIFHCIEIALIENCC